jgi:hypothetical protein
MVGPLFLFTESMRHGIDGTRLYHVAICFEAQTEKPEATSFETKLGETVNLGFEVKLRNSCSSFSFARYRLHTASPDLSIVRPPSTQLMLDHFRSSALGLLFLPRSSSLSVMPHLSPAQQETSKRDSPHE